MCRDDLDAYGQAGGVVVVDRDGDRRLAGDVEQGREHGHRVAVQQRHQGIVVGTCSQGTDGWRQAGHGGRDEEVEAGDEGFDDAPRQVLGPLHVFCVGPRVDRSCGVKQGPVVGLDSAQVRERDPGTGDVPDGRERRDQDVGRGQGEGGVDDVVAGRFERPRVASTAAAHAGSALSPSIAGSVRAPIRSPVGDAIVTALE
jgi:hypothetical protein